MFHVEASEDVAQDEVALRLVGDKSVVEPKIIELSSSQVEVDVFVPTGRLGVYIQELFFKYLLANCLILKYL